MGLSFSKDLKIQFKADVEYVAFLQKYLKLQEKFCIYEKR